MIFIFSFHKKLKHLYIFLFFSFSRYPCYCSIFIFISFSSVVGRTNGRVFLLVVRDILLEPLLTLAFHDKVSAWAHDFSSKYIADNVDDDALNKIY